MIIPLARGALPLGKLGEILRVQIPSDISTHIPRRLVTDSREISQGDLFCALMGERDGHLYAKEAAAHGAVAILAEKETEAPIPHITVPSTRRALADWAIAVTKAQCPLRIGITGSVGKTTVKDAVAAMLSTRFSVHATHENLNNDLGLPFTILSAPQNTEILICELGVNHPGEMALLSEILRPHISVITCIGHAHIGAFGSRDGIAAEKREILRYAEDGGTLYVPITEPLLFLLPPRGIRREGIAPFDAHTCQKYGIPFSEEDVPKNLAYAISTAIAKACRLTDQEISEGLTRIAALQTRRKECYHNQVRIIDDGYNASPESVMSSLLFLSRFKQGKRIAVLGDMLELGEFSCAFHHAIGRFAASCAEVLFFFGDYAYAYACGARAAGASFCGEETESKSHYFLLSGNQGRDARQIASHIEENDTILFKASRALKIESLIACVKEALF